MVTIRDVAKHAGVSPATVSRVVNGLVGYSDETRERVETAVKSLSLSMINDPKIQTATVAISKFTGATEFQAPFGEQMAAGVIVTVPLVIMVLVFQRRIVEGLTAGASK